MGPQLELGRVIPVNTSLETPDKGLELSAVGEAYTPRAIDPSTTRDHEAIHAGLGDEGDVTHVSIIPGPGYRGITQFSRPNALAAMGPHSVGAHGTSWDVMVAQHLHGNSGSLESSARAAVHERHAVIVEIGDALGRQKALSGSEVDAARKRAWMKEKYGEKATIQAKSKVTGETITISGVKVDGDRTAVPHEIADFSARVNKKLAESEVAKKDGVKTAISEVDTGKQKKTAQNSYDITSDRPWSERSAAGNNEETEKPEIVDEAERIVKAEFDKIKNAEKLEKVREELAQLQMAA